MPMRILKTSFIEILTDPKVRLKRKRMGRAISRPITTVKGLPSENFVGPLITTNRALFYRTLSQKSKSTLNEVYESLIILVIPSS